MRKLSRAEERESRLAEFGHTSGTRRVRRLGMVLRDCSTKTGEPETCRGRLGCAIVGDGSVFLKAALGSSVPE